MPFRLGLVPPLLVNCTGVTPHHLCGSPPFQIKMLSDRKRELEHRLSATLEENDLLQGTVEELQDRVLILERQGHDKDLQVLRQRSCPVEPGPGKRSASLPSPKEKLGGSCRPWGQGRCSRGLCGPCSPRALTNLASLAVPRRNTSLHTGHPSMFYSEPLAPGAVSQSSLWAITKIGAPGVSFCLLGFMKSARDFRASL